MTIYTTYFAKVKDLPKDITPISICGKAPDGWTGLQCKHLAPKWTFFQEWKKNGDNNYYIEHFQKEVLDTQDAYHIYCELLAMSPTEKIALVCYEKPTDFCHRHLVAQWLSNSLCMEIKEYEFVENAQTLG